MYDKLVSNLQESKARGAMVVAIATEGDEDIRQHADHVIYIPKVRDAFSAITASVPLQLFARAIAVERGCDVDQPRNLAKSVTVDNEPAGPPRGRRPVARAVLAALRNSLGGRRPALRLRLLFLPSANRQVGC
ncbi:MAG: SIS domain-containing protein [Eggerthellaceae bacterium]